MVHLRFGGRNDAPALRRASVGMLARKTKRFRRRGVGPEEVAERPSQSPNGSAARDCVPLKPERALAQQSEQHGEAGVLSRRGASAGSGGFPSMSELWFTL